MKYKFKKITKANRPSTAEFWYDITAGYLKPEDFSKDPATLKAINDAIELLEQLEEMCEDF